jgi:hypothetical protein
MAKSEEGRWLTYEELAKELGCTVAAARILAVRRKYPRRIPNAYRERTRVLVPEKVELPRRRRGHNRDTVEHTETVDPAPDSLDLAEAEVRELQAKLATTEARLGDAHATIDDLRRRLDASDAERR